MRRLSSSIALLLLLSSTAPTLCLGADTASTIPVDAGSAGKSVPEPILAEAPVAASEKPATGGVAGKLSYSSCNIEGNSIALTFDDGPHAQNTPRLLDILKQAGVRATFFVVGQNAVQYPDILKRIVAEGHELANHSYSHPLLASLSESSVHDQLDRTHEAVLKATGVSMKIMRPPYGALSEPQRRMVHADYGYKTILWDVDPEDWKYRDAARVEREIVGRTRAGSIILSHDIHKTTIDAMPSTIEALSAKGFKFVTVSELLALDKPAAPKTPNPIASATPKPAPKPPREDSEKSEKSSKSEKTEKPKTSAQKDAALREVPREADSRAKSTSSSDESVAAKQRALTQEELRKKWLSGTK
jgi:peptidoglycan/xylan/chitin deacetylase (PgdA/CDA1 family)